MIVEHFGQGALVASASETLVAASPAWIIGPHSKRQCCITSFNNRCTLEERGSGLPDWQSRLPGVVQGNLRPTQRLAYWIGNACPTLPSLRHLKPGSCTGAFPLRNPGSGTFVPAANCSKIAACRRKTLMLSQFVELEVINVLIACAILGTMYILCRDTRQSNESKPSPGIFCNPASAPSCLLWRVS